jgi:hypothetical protein
MNASLPFPKENAPGSFRPSWCRRTKMEDGDGGQTGRFFFSRENHQNHSAGLKLRSLKNGGDDETRTRDLCRGS